MASLDTGSIDVVITDPPYEAEAHTSERLVARTGGRLAVEPSAFPPITEEQRVESSRQMARLARRWILVFCQVEAAMKWRAALEVSGAVYKRGSHGVFIVNKGGDPRTGHQTQKPLALMELLVRLFSNHGELILDPFAGPGTTGVAAIRNGRRFLGWEMNEGYAGVARRRLCAAREQLGLDL